MHFGIIEYTEEGGFVEINGKTTHHGTVLYPDSFSARTSPSAFNVIYLTARMERTLVFDLEFPGPLTGKNLIQAMTFKLEQMIPVPLDQVYTGYIRLSRDNRHFRVYAVLREEADSLLRKVREAGFCCDCFMPAQLLTEEADSGMTPGKELLEYLNRDHTGWNLHLCTSAIPAEMRPVRHRQWRLVFNISLAIAAVLMVFLLVLRFRYTKAEYDSLKKGRKILEQQYKEATLAHSQLTKTENLSSKIMNLKLNAAPTLPILCDLNERLPEYMYLTAYRQNGDQIDVTIFSTKDDPGLPRTLLASKLYKSDMRKTVQENGTETVYNVTLRSTVK